MKQRGRKSAASAEVISIDLATRPRAPEELIVSEASLWNEIVASRPADFFDAASIPLLVEYCRVKTQLDQVAISLNEFEDEWLKKADGLRRYKELAMLQDKAQSRLVILATKMRLAQQSRFVPNHSKNRPNPSGGPKPWES